MHWCVSIWILLAHCQIDGAAIPNSHRVQEHGFGNKYILVCKIYIDITLFLAVHVTQLVSYIATVVNIYWMSKFHNVILWNELLISTNVIVKAHLVWILSLCLPVIDIHKNVQSPVGLPGGKFYLLQGCIFRNITSNNYNIATIT